LLAVLAIACAAAFTLTFLIALHTARGLSIDRSAFERVSGNAPLPFRTAGQRTLRTIDGAMVAGGLIAVTFLALVRGRVARAVAAAALVALSVGSAEALKHGLPRLDGAVASDRPSTFPSGHTAVAVSLGLALVVAVPPVLRSTAALFGAAYGAAIAFSVVVLGWHYPSDAIGSFFLCGFWAAAVGIALRGAPRRPELSLRGTAVVLAAVALALAAAAALAARHPVAVASVRSRPALVAAAAAYGLLSLALFAAVTPLVGERRRR
jgi:membrane-associated phospholipid phosphatase